MAMYTTDNLGRLPYSALLNSGDPTLLQEMMITYIPPDLSAERLFHGSTGAGDESAYPLRVDTRGFDGIGILYVTGYTTVPDIFYCPSHRGDHPLERYAAGYERPSGLMYSNYQYRGDIDIDSETGVRRALTLDRDAARVLLTDGMRTKRDFNHRWGYNSLFGDGSVWYRVDINERIYRMLPDGRVLGDGVQGLYEEIWEIIDKGAVN